MRHVLGADIAPGDAYAVVDPHDPDIEPPERTARPLQVEVLSDTGFHLGAGLYFGYAGHHHGEYRGVLHTEGERIADCTVPSVARDLHQIRDTVVRVTDPVGGGVGIGNMQPIVSGAFPHLGLDAESSFL